MFRLSTFSMVDNVFEAEPNTNWKLKSCKGLELTYKTAKRTETDVKNSLHGRPSWLHFFLCKWLGVNIPDMEIEFTVEDNLVRQF